MARKKENFCGPFLKKKKKIGSGAKVIPKTADK